MRRAALALFVAASFGCRKERATIGATHDEPRDASHAVVSSRPRAPGALETCEGPSFDVGPNAFAWAESEGPGCTPRLFVGGWSATPRAVANTDYVSIAVDANDVFVWTDVGIERFSLRAPNDRSVVASLAEPVAALVVDDAVYFSLQNNPKWRPSRVEVVAKTGGAVRTFAELDAVDPPPGRPSVTRLFVDATAVYAVECDADCRVKRVARDGGTVTTVAVFRFAEGIPECAAAEGEVFCATRFRLSRVAPSKVDVAVADEDGTSGAVAVGRDDVCWVHDAVVSCHARDGAGAARTFVRDVGRWARVRVRDDVLYVRDGKTIRWFPLD